MAINVYLTPSVGTGSAKDMLRSKWRDEVNAAGCVFGQLKYGGEPTFLLAARDVPADLHATIAADAACLACPPLGDTVGAGALATVRSKLEAFNIPGNWVAAGDIYQSICQVVGHLCEFAVRWEGLGYARLFGGTVTLDTTWGSLGAQVQSDLKVVADSFGLDYGAVTANTRMRAILKGFADQMTGVPVAIGPITL